MNQVEREIKLLQSIDHKHIVKVHSKILSNNSINLVMDYVEGKPLNRYLNSYTSRSLKESQAKPLLKQVFEAINHLHE